MAETLLAILLVTTSAKGSNLVYRWPPSPVSSPRLSRVRPDTINWLCQFDNPWKASHNSGHQSDTPPQPYNHSYDNDPEYYWQRPVVRDQPLPYSQSTLPASGRNSPTKDNAFDVGPSSSLDEYNHLFSYSSEFLAGMLCPQRMMCHQKFELIVDDLAFIGHPVCADSDGEWRFKPEKCKPGMRGRESRGDRTTSNSPRPSERTSESPDKSAMESPPVSKSSWLHTFHFVLVLDLPDPSSSASGNISKYFDVIYQQIAFTVTAVLYQEQVLSNFVETECDILGSLKDSCSSKGEEFSAYATQALAISSIAPAMKTIFESIKSSSMAYVTINNIPLELQLPPHLDQLLHSEGEIDSEDFDLPDVDGGQSWGPEMSLGWRLPTLAPWKSLLLLDHHDGMDPYTNLSGPHVNPEDRSIAEGLIRFLETASVTLSLAEMAVLLDWDLDSQVYPTVRWLVLHRRAKVVDAVHPGLKTVFALSAKFEHPLSQLITDFENKFSDPVLPLPNILSVISTSMSKKSDNHFFASVVKTKECIPVYLDAVIWMLKRDMLLTLHLRIRVVATEEIKQRVRQDHESGLTRTSLGITGRGRIQLKKATDPDIATQDRVGVAWMSMSPRSARRYSRRLPSNESGKSEISALIINEDDNDFGLEKKGDDGFSDIESEIDEYDSGWDTTEDHNNPTMISDPGRATPLQRRWLSAMSDGKEPHIARRFELINQYFDGKHSDDEILFQAEISRKHLREVLHHYEEYLQTFLHP